MQDNWSGRTWTLNDAVGEDPNGSFATDMMVAGGPTAFTLTPIEVDGVLRCFRVDYISGQMTSTWQDPVYLLWRGSTPATPPVGTDLPTLPLPKWQPPSSAGGVPPLRSQYLTIATAIASPDDFDPTVERLEGDLHFGGVAEAVTLYQVQPPGVLAGSPFLVINVQAKEASVGTRQSGIAHGNS